MLRVATLVAALAAFPAAGFAAPRADTPASAGPVAKVVACDVTSNDKAATFYGRMDSITGAGKMQIRFQLLERLGRDDTWSKLDVPTLRQWHTSQSGVKRFGWKQTVDALHVGGAYKARVQYRWLSPAGTVLETESRDTPVCRGPLPTSWWAICRASLGLLPTRAPIASRFRTAARSTPTRSMSR